MKTQRQKTLALLCAILYLTYIYYAIYNNILNNSATVIMSHFSIGESRQGLIVTVQAIGGLASGLLLAFFGERFNKIRSLAAGVIILAAASLMFSFSPSFSYGYMLICAVVAGFGVTLIDILINGTIPDVFRSRSSTLLPVGQGVYSIGAMSAPIIVTALINPQQTSSYSRAYLVVVALGSVLAAALLIASRFATQYTPYADMSKIKASASGNPAEIFKSKKAWIIIAISFLYYSFELGYCTWLPTYAQKVLGMTFADAGRLMSLVFLGNLIMRFASPLLLKRMSTRRAFILLCSAAFVSATACFIIKSASLAFVLMPLAAFFSGAASPSIMLISTSVFPTRTASASSAVIMSISLSSIIVPYFMGIIAEKFSFSLSIFVIVILLGLSVIAMYLFKDQSPVTSRQL